MADKNPYSRINQQLKSDSEKIFKSSNIDNNDIQELKEAAENTKIILTHVESNETTDLIQAFLNFVIRLCG